MNTQIPATGVFADAYSEEIISHLMETLNKWCVDVESCVDETNQQTRYDASDIGPDSELEFWRRQAAAALSH